MIRLTLPWWPKELKANGGFGNRFAHHRAAKKYKSDCGFLSKDQGLGPLDAARLKLTFEFRPKTRNLPDKDNCVHSCKYLIDAIAAVTGIDDSKFDYGEHTIGEPVKGGAVLVDIEEG